MEHAACVAVANLESKSELSSLAAVLLPSSPALQEASCLFIAPPAPPMTLGAASPSLEEIRHAGDQTNIEFSKF